MDFLQAKCLSNATHKSLPSIMTDGHLTEISSITFHPTCHWLFYWHSKLPTVRIVTETLVYDKKVLNY